MSAWTAAIHNSFCMFLIVRQWSYHCVQWQIDSVGVFVWAPAPFFVCFVCFSAVASLFPLAKRKSGWGICGSSFLFSWVLGLLFLSICQLQGPCVLVQCIFSLLSCKDRALARHRPHSRKKKWSSRLALRPASNHTHFQNFLFGCNFHILEASRLALRPSLCASCGLKF